jgi:iron complex transport system substrate-binding protein
VLLDGAFAKTPEIYRLLGDLLGVKERGEQLAHDADETLNGLAARVVSIPEASRPRVYYGRGVNGLETGLAGSINMEVLDKVGATNVAATAGTGGITKVSIEQVLAWNPDVILVLDPAFYRAVVADPLWASVRAVRDKRTYLAPNLDAPPGVNRLIGVRWLMSLLYPKQFPDDLRGVTRDFFKRFYHVDVTEQQLEALLASATPAK